MRRRRQRRNRHPYLVEGSAHVLAHRGASGLCPPGNSEAAFRAALAAGVDHLETDAQLSADGEVVLFHDDRLDESTTGRGRVAEHTWAELAALRYRNGEVVTEQGPIRLAEALDRFPSARWNIDVKVDAAVEPVVALLREAGCERRVCVASFSWRRVRRLRKLLGSPWCSALSGVELAVVRVLSWLPLPLPVPVGGDVAQAPRRHSSGLPVVDQRFVRTCRRAGLAVHVWTIDEPAEARRLLDLGVDGVISDRPGLLVRALGGAAGRPSGV